MNLFSTIDDLTFVKDLGLGSFGNVFLYKRINTNELFAVKIIDKMRVKGTKYFKYLDSEVKALSKFDDPHIIKFKKIKYPDSEYSNYILIIMEYCNGYSLSECLRNYKERYGKPFSEEIVQYLSRQIVQGLIRIHKENIIHRDLKLDNIMVHFDNEIDKINLNMMKGTIKIIDFGISKILSSSDGYATSLVGTPYYTEPEILENMKKENKDKNFHYSKEADIWSLGCVCYEMIDGKKVFTENKNELYDKIKDGKYKIRKTVSKEFISFLCSMLKYDGKQRITAEQLLDKTFLKKDIKEFHYLSVNHDLKQDKEFIEFKSSIKMYTEQVNKNNQPNYKRASTSDQIYMNKINNNFNINMPNQTNNQNNNNNNFDYNEFYNKNFAFSFYGQNMNPVNQSTNSSSNMNNISNKISLSKSLGPKANINTNQPHFNLHNSVNYNNNIQYNLNNTNNNYPQGNNNLNMNPPLRTYHSQPLNNVNIYF